MVEGMKPYLSSTAAAPSMPMQGVGVYISAAEATNEESLPERINRLTKDLTACGYRLVETREMARAALYERDQAEKLFAELTAQLMEATKALGTLNVDR